MKDLHFLCINTGKTDGFSKSTSAPAGEAWKDLTVFQGRQRPTSKPRVNLMLTHVQTPLPSPQDLLLGQHELMWAGSSADIPVFLPVHSTPRGYITTGRLPGESLPLGQQEEPTFPHCLFLSCLYLESTAY